ncbi:MAG: hypothetical protein ACO3ZW_02975 [Opitutales bacterium]|jgi:hypothetical protein
MPPYIHRPFLVLSAVAFLAHPRLASETDPPPTLEDVEALLQETDALLESLAPAIEPEPVDEPGVIILGSLKAGFGYSSNYLNRHQPVSSTFTHIEADALLNWGTGQFDLVGLFFAEALLYDHDLDPSSETMGFSQVKGVLHRGAFDYGLELATMYGSMIYDSSLTTLSTPAGTRIQQFVPSVQIFVDWFTSGSDRFRIGLSPTRAEFNIEGQDYWDYALKAEWEHLWSGSIRSLTRLILSRQAYDDDLARAPNGDSLPGEIGLRVNRWSLEERLTLHPSSQPWLKLSLLAGLAMEEEEEGQHEALVQSWLGLGMTVTSRWGRFTATGRWGEYRYRDRVVLVETLDLQTVKSLSLEYERFLPLDLSLVVRARWNSHTYRLEENLPATLQDDDSYSERRAEVLLEWSY